MEKVYEREYAGHRLRFAFVHPSTRLFFDPTLRPVSGEPVILATEQRIEGARRKLPEEAKIGYVENQTLIGLAGQALLRYGCCIFHAVSFIFGEDAYLLAAPSGTGKSTQYFNWQRLHPGEIRMISGDMPVLEHREDGSVWVHPSNWNGKEKIGGKDPARLRGVVLLEQGKENRIRRLSPQDAIPPLFRQFVADLEREEEVQALASLLERMLLTAPVWQFVNLGDDASTELLRRELLWNAERE